MSFPAKRYTNALFLALLVEALRIEIPVAQDAPLAKYLFYFAFEVREIIQ